MSIRLRLREFFRHLYARVFGAFALFKTIESAELLLCSELGFPLLNIRCRKCEYSLHYTKNSTGISVIVYDANFYPHAYRLIVSSESKEVIVRDDPKETGSIGQMRIYENKMTSINFHGPIEEVHTLHADCRHAVAGAPVVEVSDEYKDGLWAAEDSTPLSSTEHLVRVTDRPGAIRFLPLMTYTGKGHVHK